MIELLGSFSSVIEGLAVADAYANLDNNPGYWDAVIGYSFDKANNSFNAEVAAAAASWDGLKHMFEWGTNGINRGATNMRPQPREERARLWETIMLNNGPHGGVQVMFEFKPSVANVPIPTTVPQEIRAMMRPHVFKWKARVMENNEPVHISKDEAEFLLIPYNPNLTGFKSYDIKRGYKLTRRDIDAYPGKRSHGNFTAYFDRYWKSRGPELMERTLIEQMDIDYVPLMAAANRIKGGKSGKIDVAAAVRARSAGLQRQVTADAKARRKRV